MQHGICVTTNSLCCTWGWNLQRQCNRCCAHRLKICNFSCSSAAPFKSHTLIAWYSVSMLAPEVCVAAAQQLCCTSPLLQSVCRCNTHCCCLTLFLNVMCNSIPADLLQHDCLITAVIFCCCLTLLLCNRRGAPTSALTCAVLGAPLGRWTSTHRR